MSDTLIPSATWPSRIEERALAEHASDVIEQVRRTGESIEIVKDGAPVARLVPVAAAPAAGARRSVIGRGIGVIGLVTPGDTLDNLLTTEEIDDFYKGDALTNSE